MSTREEILNNLEAKLKTIKLRNGYKTEIKLVTKLATSELDITLGLPAIVIIDHEDELVKINDTARIEELNIALEGRVEHHNDNDLRPDFEKFLADARKCLSTIEAPAVLHNNVHFVRPGGCSIKHGQNCMGFEIELTIRYYYLKVSP